MHAVTVGPSRWAAVAAVVCVAAFLAVCPQPAAASQKSRIDAAIRKAVKTGDINAVIVQATVNGKTVIKKAYGESTTGVPATVDMHFRNGNVVAPYMSTLLLELVEQGKVKLSDPISKFVPGMPDGDRVTLQMLANMTSGYDDYVRQTNFILAFYANPFANFSTKKQLDIGLAKCIRPKPSTGCVQFTPGSNFSYAHTNYVILGLALEKITKLPLETALSRFVLKPLGLKNTRASQTAAIPEPVLHTFSSERRGFFDVPADTPFSEETTFWNPSWSFARGSVETSTIEDLTHSAIAIGEGKLLSRRSYRLQINPRIGFGRTQDNCPGCYTLTRAKGYGLGVFRNGSWIAAQPLLAGLGAVSAYNPSKRVSVAVTVALGAGAYDSGGVPIDYHKLLYNTIAKILAPNDPPPPS
jgi:CubicO group peptidase (beta-lactamase class C family)